MARKKVKTAEEPRTDLWELYQSMQLPEEEKAKGRAQVEAACEEAARNGVYERLIELVGTGVFRPEFYRNLREEDDEDERY